MSNINWNDPKLRRISPEKKKILIQLEKEIQNMPSTNNLIAANGLIISKLYNSLDTINLKFNEILNSTSSLEGLITTANVKAKNLVADSYELNNALHQFGTVSYAISRLNKK